MPNWCSNSLTVFHSDPAMMAKFAAAIKEGNLFDTFIPMPKELEETTSPSPTTNDDLVRRYGADNWYEWHVNNWGTKWDISDGDFELSEDGKEGNGWFQTAWSPPIAAYEKLKELGFEIDATYYESGMLYAGHWNDGEDYYVESWDFEDSNWREGIEDVDVLDLLESEYESWLQWREEE